MKDNEWISVEERLPKIDETVFTKSFGINSNEFYIDAVLKKIDKSNYKFFPKGNNNETLWDIHYWRPIPEKRPDFSKLNERDLIAINSSELTRHTTVGFIKSIDDNEIILDNCYGYRILSIKKITRINLQEKTFEEI